MRRARCRGNCLLLLLLLLLCLLLPSCRCFVAVAVEGWGRGRLIRSVDGGSSWQTLVESYINLQAVATPSPYAVVAVGSNGTVIVSAANATLTPELTAELTAAPAAAACGPLYGSAYPGSYLSLVEQGAALSNSSSSACSGYWRSLQPPLPSTAWTPAPSAFLYASLSPATTSELRAVRFLSPFLGLAVGTAGVVYRSLDAGWHWTLTPLPFTLDLNALAFAAAPQPSAGWTVMAAGNVGSVLISTDAGLSWRLSTTASSQNLYGLAMADGLTALACGAAATLLQTTDGGASWAALSQPAFASFAFYSVAFLNLSLAFISGSDSLLLMLLRSADGGVSLQQVAVEAAPFVTRFAALFLMPSTLLAAGRSRLHAAAASAPSVWTAGPVVNINSISSVAALEAGVLTLGLPVFNLSAFCGSAITFNLSVRNTGTDGLSISAVASADGSVLLQQPSAAAFPLRLEPAAAALMLNFSYAASSSACSSASTQYTNLTLLTDAPVQAVAVYFSVYTLPVPSSTSSSFLSQYWYVVALIASAVAALLLVFVRRRLRYVRRWNRRVLYDDERLRFWGCWLLSKEIEHESDSDFWSEDDEDEEQEEGGGDDGQTADDDDDGAGDDYEDDDTDRLGDADSEGSTVRRRGGGRRGEAAARRRRRRQRRGRSHSQLSAAGGSAASDDGDDEGSSASRWTDGSRSSSSVSSQEFHDEEVTRRVVKDLRRRRRSSLILSQREQSVRRRQGSLSRSRRGSVSVSAAPSVLPEQETRR